MDLTRGVRVACGVRMIVRRNLPADKLCLETNVGHTCNYVQISQQACHHLVKRKHGAKPYLELYPRSLARRLTTK